MIPPGARRPASFDADLSRQWSRWVLEHGLPQLPAPDLAIGESVPVAYRIGPDTAAVLHISRTLDDGAQAVRTDTDVDLFSLVDGVWVEWGGGGAGGSNDSPLARIDVPPDHVDLSGTVAAGGERGCKALWGEVGVSAAVAEVEQAGRVTRRPVEAPIGAFVVCARPRASLHRQGHGRGRPAPGHRRGAGRIRRRVDVTQADLTGSSISMPTCGPITGLSNGSVTTVKPIRS
jgi:hypothetical protein